MAKTGYKKKAKVAAPEFPQWKELLDTVVTTPGYVGECYKAFHDYSPGNQMLAMWQCHARKIEPGPIGTYKFWKDMGRQVTSGLGSAIYLCRPVTWRAKEEVEGECESVVHVSFKYEPRWFVLSQTQGEEYIAPPLPGWELGNALWGLEIEPMVFTDMSGNCMGYARERTFAVNPLNNHATATIVHELAHIVLGHTEEGLVADGKDRTPTDIREMEAESTALIVLDQLGLTDHAASRGYIQAWYKGNEIPEESARKIFAAANTILAAGRKA